MQCQHLNRYQNRIVNPFTRREDWETICRDCGKALTNDEIFKIKQKEQKPIIIWG